MEKQTGYYTCPNCRLTFVKESSTTPGMANCIKCFMCVYPKDIVSKLKKKKNILI